MLTRMSVRAARLLAILDNLRTRRRPVSAQELAKQHEVSERTIYRDISSLRHQGASIEGEAGVGYRMAPGFVLPPLSFSEEEIEAIVLGIRWVVLQGDPELAESAQRSLSRIFDTLPPKLRIAMETCGLLVPPCNTPRHEPWLPKLRAAVREERMVYLEYKDRNGQSSERRVWPFMLAFFQNVRLVAAWCELRQDFRSFRADRIVSLRDTPERYPHRRHQLIARWRQQQGLDPS